MARKISALFFAMVMLIGAVSLFPLQPATVLAEKCASEDGLAIVSIKPWYSGVCKPGTDEVEIKSIPGDIIIIALNLLSIAVQIGGYAAVGLVIWGGIKYILSNGDTGKITAAKSTIQNALIGLLIVLTSLTLINFVTGLYN